MFEIKSLPQVIKEDIEYRKSINSGSISPINTGYNFINEKLLNGLLKGDTVTISGLSGAGKTAMGINIAFNILSLNKDIRVLYLTLELAARKIVARKVSSVNKELLKNIYTKDTKIQVTDYSSFNDYPLDFVEVPTNIDYIIKGLRDYCIKHHDKMIGVIIDHTLLVEPRKGDNDMNTLVEISRMVNKLKKQHNMFFILLSQLNNAMLNPSRLSTKFGQYPDQTDIFGSKYIFHISENVIVLINPNRLNLPGKTYGIHDLPLAISGKDKTIYQLIYAFHLKARDGNVGIDPLINMLQYNLLPEFSQTQSKIFKEKYKLNTYG